MVIAGDGTVTHKKCWSFWSYHLDTKSDVFSFGCILYEAATGRRPFEGKDVLAGTAMSLVMGVGFAGLLVIPPAVGYISSAVGGTAGDVRSGLMVVIAACVLMLILHALLLLRERGLRPD